MEKTLFLVLIILYRSVENIHSVKMSWQNWSYVSIAGNNLSFVIVWSNEFIFGLPVYVKTQYDPC